MTDITQLITECAKSVDIHHLSPEQLIAIKKRIMTLDDIFKNIILSDIKHEHITSLDRPWITGVAHKDEDLNVNIFDKHHNKTNDNFFKISGNIY